MKNDRLSGRERVRLALQHQETDRIPIAMVCSGINPPAYADLEAYLRRERGQTAAEYLAPLIDIRGVGPSYCGPRLAPGMDIWGVRRKEVSYGAGAYDEIETYPLAGAAHVGDLEAHAWPSPDWFDYPSLKEAIATARAEGDPCLMISNGNLFETAWYMRGFERALLDFILNPELIHSILERVTVFYLEHFTRLLEAADGQVDLAFTADDIGGQNGLLMSRRTWEEFIQPCHARLNRAIHEFGVKVIYHTDGSIMQAVDGLIDMGIDVLQALQFSARGMDPALLKEKYGDRLCFEGGVSVQTTLPFGSVQEVRQEVTSLIEILGKDGGYILGPSHAIQAGTPPENILALFDTAVGNAR
jgi:uroporphyrinogen decarboxylase